MYTIYYSGKCLITRSVSRGIIYTNSSLE